MSVEDRVRAPNTEDAPWDRITRSPEKRDAFAVDPDFRYGWHRMRRADVDIARLARDFAFMSFKPEAFYARKVEAGLEFLRSRGYEPLLTEIMHLTNAHLSQIWRYQLNAAPPGHLDMIFDVISRRPMLAILVGRARGRSLSPSDGHLPLSVELSDLKEDASGGRGPETLRGFFSCPNRHLNFVHVSDEPADVVRELPLLFSRRAYDECLRICADEGAAAPRPLDRDALLATYDDVGESDLDPKAAVARLIAAFTATGAPVPSELVFADAGRRDLAARSLIEAVQACPGAWAELDLYLAVSEYCTKRDERFQVSVAKVLPEAWKPRG